MTQILIACVHGSTCRIEFQQFLFLNFASFSPEKLWGFVLGSPAARSQSQGLGLAQQVQAGCAWLSQGINGDKKPTHAEWGMQLTNCKKGCFLKACERCLNEGRTGSCVH